MANIIPDANDDISKPVLPFSKTDEIDYRNLLGLAEFFRSCQPSRIRETIHCLQATLSIETLPLLEKAKCRLNLAKLLLQHTKNVGHARAQLEQAHQITSFEKDDGISSKIYFDSTSILASLCIEQDAHSRDREYDVSIELLSALGESTAKENRHEYIRILYMLSKCLLYLASKDLPKFEQTLNSVEPMKQEYVGKAPSIHKRETIKIFSGFLKVYYYIVTGRPKTGKEDLKELQRSIQTLAATPDEVPIPDDPEGFQWLSKDHLCVLVYLVTVMHSMHSGLMDRALRHTEKALSLIEKLKAVGNENRVTSFFNLSLLEHAVMCRIIQGQGSHAIQEIGKACQLCSEDQQLMTSMKPALHTLLGLYGMSMNLMGDAEEHFKKALRFSNNQCDVYCVAAMNLAVIYIRNGPQKAVAFQQLLESLNSDTISRSKNLRSSYFYMMGLKTFFESNYDDAKKFLRESLRIGNTEDLNRMTACSLILLGHVITSQANAQEAVTMVVPAMQVANKIPDVYLQLWASSLLKDIYRLLNDQQGEQEGAQLHNMYTTQLLQDHFMAGQRTEHALLKDFV
ncbi:MAU2 chromatid cohesion factor homolog isoform X2 [Clytia hemisphaerica]|uniref:MAU2 chromatid cohesion factor homolog isoform X2 n=1 Tax=Clytia hemisphaerica TaxID=252671 RepID=UPI0034D67FC9